MEQRPLEERLAELSIRDLNKRLRMPGVGEPYKRAVRKALAAKRGEPGPEQIEPAAGVVVHRVHITLPWDHLATDNYNELINPKRKRYTEAKRQFRERVMEQYSGAPIAMPVHIDVALYLPDERDLDPTNFWKLIADSIKGLVVKDDAWRYMADSRIRVAGLDRANPRAELTVVDARSAPPPA